MHWAMCEGSTMTLLRLIARPASLFVLASSSHAAPSAQALLAAGGAVCNTERPFGPTVALVEYGNGRQTDSDTLALY
jgi:hypothetical protein